MGQQQAFPLLEPIKKDDPIVVRHKGGLTKTAFFVKFIDDKRFSVKFELAGERVAFFEDGSFEVKRQKERGMIWWSIDLHDLDRIRKQYADKRNQVK